MFPDDTTLKRCTKCGEVKSRDQFSKDRRRKDGLCLHCKACNAVYRAENRESIREYKRRWHIENAETVRDRVRKWYADNHEAAKEYRRRKHAENREENRERSRKYHAEHRDAALEYKRRYYAEHRDKALKQGRQYRIENKEMLREYFRRYRIENPEVERSAHQRRKARLRGLPNTLSVTDITFAFESFGQCCAACGQQLNGLFHRDHLDHWIPLVSPDCPGTVAHNMVPLCSDCNLSKGGKQPAEWLIERFGTRKGRAILKRIEVFLDNRKT